MADHMTAEQLSGELRELAIIVDRLDVQHADDAARCEQLHAKLLDLAARLSGMAADTWQPIETAPKDGLVTELQYTGGQVTRGHWVPQLRMWNCYGVFRDPAEFTTWFRIPEPPHG